MKKLDKRNVLYVNGELDVLAYYSRASCILKEFLKNKKIATKIHLKNLFFLKRGSNSKPLYIEDFSFVNNKMLVLRKFHLKEVRNELDKKQELIWSYFPPRKLIQFFYACNDEGIGKPIERIFIDIDRKKNSKDDARIVALTLIETIKKDKEFNQQFNYRIVVLWTGASFHVYLLLKKKISLKLYEKFLSYGKKKEKSFIMKWAFQVNEKTGIKVLAGHEKSEDFIIFDSSNTPSGKLARCPFSLHIKDYKENFEKIRKSKFSKKNFAQISFGNRNYAKFSKEYDGVCVPISIKDLKNKLLIKKLEKLTPEKVLENIDEYKKLL